MFFLHQIKKTNSEYEKGIVIKNSFDDALQSYHAYMGAYAYNHDNNTTFVLAMVTDASGAVLVKDAWTSSEVNE